MANDLVISVGASIRDLERQMKAAADVAARRADEIEADFKRRNPSFAGDFGLGILKGALAGIAIDKVTQGLMEANKEIASFGDNARRAGLDLGRFQELRIAAQGLGIEGKTFDAGVDGFAKKLNEARTEENELSKLFDANNIKLKTRTGELISTNDALSAAADLISRAATEQDKIAIAEKLGLPNDFVPLLERGAEALGELGRKARESGAILDSEVVAKAKEFDTAWNNAWASFASNSKAAIVTAGQGLAGLTAQAAAYLKTVNEANTAQSQSAERAARRDQARQMALGNAGGRDAIDAEAAAAARQARARFIASEKDRSVTTSLPPSRPSREYLGKDVTKIPGKDKSGGSGGGKSEEEQAQGRLDRYIESLIRQRAVMEAEIATVGKSNAERKAAVEIAKAQVDLDKLSASEKASYIAKLTQEVTANEAVRASKERLYQSQKDLNEAQKYFGNAAVDALEDLIVNGAKAEDVMKRLTASLLKAALQAALLGEGPLAGIFGTRGAGGNVGGLFGMLFGSGVKAASGGHVTGPGTGRSDSIPARLSNGEFVVNAAATRQNRALLEAINSGRLPAFADGGLVGRVPSVTPGMANAGSGMKVVVNNSAADKVEAKPERGPDGSLQLLISAIKNDLAQDVMRPGSALAQALQARQTNRHLRG